jgi:hypothetical protein
MNEGGVTVVAAYDAISMHFGEGGAAVSDPHPSTERETPAKNNAVKGCLISSRLLLGSISEVPA